MKLSKNQNGIAHLAAIVIIILIAGLGFAGWRVYSVQKENDKLKENTSQPEVKTEDVSTDVPEGFVEYKNEQLGIQFMYPKEWGDISLAQHHRSRDEFEPVKTHFISIGKFIIKISPDSWRFTGGDSHWDYAMDDESFQRAASGGEGIIEFLKTPDSYLQSYFAGIDQDVKLQGAKKIKLPKIPASFAEFEWAPVSENCTVTYTKEAGYQDKKPSETCYEKNLIDQTKQVIQSFKAI